MIVRWPVLAVLLAFEMNHAPAAGFAQQAQTEESAPEPKDIPARFSDITKQSGVDFQYKSSHTTRKYLIETMGAGVALFDYDNDGRLDIFLVNGAPLDDPTPKGTIPKKNCSRVLEPVVSP